MQVGGYWERPTGFTFEHCRALVEHMPTIQGIILRCQRQASLFLRTYERGRERYFEVRRSDDNDPGQGRRGKEEMALEQFLLHSGWERDPIRMARLGREPMTTTVSKAIRDLLTYGAWAMETVNVRNGRMIDGYHTIDASTIRLASEQGYNGDDEVIAVQVVNGSAVTAYTHNDLVYTLLDPRSDVRSGGYGYAPPEMLVKVATGWLNAMSYNIAGFDRNSIPKGLLTVIGSYDQKQAAAFKRQWNAMVSGIDNRWKLPVLFSDTKEGGAEFTKFGVEHDEMYFAKYLIWLQSLIALIYGMHPIVIHSESFSAGKSSLSGSDSTEALAESRDTGLEPRMNLIEDTFSNRILSRIHPDYVMRVQGLRPTDAAWDHEGMKLTMSVKQLKQRLGIEVLNQPWEDAPLNPNLQSIYTQQLQQEQQERAAAQQQQHALLNGGTNGAAANTDDNDPSQGGQQSAATDSGDQDAQGGQDRDRPDPETADRDTPQ